jgi:hypothetical protein
MSNVGHIVCMSAEEPKFKLIVRKTPHAPVWSVWAMLEDSPSEEIFEAASGKEVSNWINTNGKLGLKNAAKTQCLTAHVYRFVRPARPPRRH